MSDFQGWTEVPASEFAGWTEEPAGEMTAAGEKAKELARAKALGRGALQGGTFGFGDEIAGAMTGGLQAAANTSPGAALMRALGMDPVQAPAGDAYRFGRDEERNANDKAMKEQPGSYIPGSIIGAVGSGAMLPRVVAAQGAGLGAKLMASLASAVPAGLAFGAGGSKADLTQNVTPDTVSRFVGDTEAGGATAGLTAVAGTAGADLLGRIPGALKNVGINFGRKVLTNGADSMSRRGPIRASAVEEALKGGAVVPGGTTQGAFERLSGLVDKQRQPYGGMVQALEAEGIPGPDAVKLAKQLLDEANALEPNTMIDEIPALYRDAARKAVEKADRLTLRLGLSQNEGLKQSLQNPRLYGRTGSSDIDLAPERRDIASMFRQASEDAIDEGAAARPQNQRIQELSRSFVPVKQRYGNLTEARDAAERGAARGAQRSNIGPKEMAMGAGKLATGDTLGALKAIGLTKLLTSRGPSTAAWGAYNAGRLGETLGLPFGAVGKALGPGTGGQLPEIFQDELMRAEALRRGGTP